MPSPRSIVRAPLAVFAGAALLYGCASSPPSAGEKVSPAASPLAGMIGRQLLILPTQYLSVANAAGSYDIVPGGVEVLPLLDDEITDAFRSRGVKSNWTFGREIIARADRNGGLAGDARELSAQGVRRMKAGDTPLPEPLASEVRGLIALTSARYAILPLEVRLDLRNGERRAAVRMLLIDSRTARVAWADDVEAEPTRDPQIVADALSPFGFRRLARELATRFADMVVPQ